MGEKCKNENCEKRLMWERENGLCEYCNLEYLNKLGKERRIKELGIASSENSAR